MATPRNLPKIIELCGESNVSLMIWGVHGVGKSQIVEQTAHNNRMGCINYRVSQIEASDLRGLPTERDGYTVYCPPTQLPVGDMPWEEFAERIAAEEDPKNRNELIVRLQPRLEKGILFLDECFRGQDDVQQALFELVLERKIGDYVLPPGWWVVCANNPPKDYALNMLPDPALLDRFCHVRFNTVDSIEDWAKWMADTHGDSAAEIIEFCTASPEHLDPDISIDLEFSPTPSRRTWDAVTRVRKIAQERGINYDIQKEVMDGLVGVSMATKFENYSCPISAKDIIENGHKKYIEELRGLQRNQKTGLVYSMTAFMFQKIDKKSKKAMENAFDFAEFMIGKEHNERDLIAGFLHSMMIYSKSGQDSSFTSKVMQSHKMFNIVKQMFEDEGNKELLKDVPLFSQILMERPKLSKLMHELFSGIDIGLETGEKDG